MRTRFTSVAIVISLGLSAAFAGQTDKQGIALCDTTLNNAIEAIRHSDFERAQRSSPALLDCLSIYKAVQYEEVKKSVIVEEVLKKLELEKLRPRP